MKTFDEVYQTVTANGMRELTYERARQIAFEYASQFIDKAAEIAKVKANYEKNYSEVDKEVILSLKIELK